MSDESRYILVEKLTRGGMAEIYLGRASSKDGFKRVCCIKRILPHYSQEKEYIEMFRDEAHICKRLEHANIVRVEGFEEVEDSYAIIMEFVDGADLRKILVGCENAGTTLPIPFAIYIAAEIARGLHYAHTKIDDITEKALKIVHRDVSPQNILVSFEGETKITDFGIAQAKSKSTETKPGIVKGKYSYMSPEQIMAKPVDARTDVFALGIVLWEMVAMERLFHGENDVITIQKVKNCEIKRIPRGQKRKENEVDDELEAIILQALQKDLKKRYRDAKQFEVALRKYLNKKFPSFSPNELSSFLKELLADQVLKSKETIRKALTTTDISPNKAKMPVKIYESGVSQVSNNGTDLDQVPMGRIPDFSVIKSQVAVARQTPNKVGPSVSNLQRNDQFRNLKPATGMRPQQTLPYYPKKSTSKFLLIAVAALFSLAGISIVAKRFYQSRTAPAIITIETTPPNVRIKLDGIPLYDDRYVQTPIKPKISIGDHVLTFNRDGFSTDTVEITANAGDKNEKIDVVLSRKAIFAPVRLKIGDPSIDKIWTDIDNGIDSGFAPRKIDDLTYGKIHFMRVFPNYPKRKNSFTCSFIAKSKTWRAPFMVVIYPQTGKCSVSAP
jgi:serine/threonine protein kinase